MINFDNFYIKDKLIAFLKEDINFQDKTSDNLSKLSKQVYARIIAKENGILAGVYFAKEVFKLLNIDTEFKILKKDGQKIKKGDFVLEIKGNGRDILKGERLALDIIQRLSGISTLTKKYVDKIKDLKVKLVATRKATPGFAIFEKYATFIGGAHLHRYNLFDSIIIKDNHLSIYENNISEIIKEIKNNIPYTDKIEIEVSNLDQFMRAINNGADIIMLDNMKIEDIKKAVQYRNKINKYVVLEASGGINYNNIRDYAKTGVDVISSGALIHQAKWLDFSLYMEVK